MKTFHFDEWGPFHNFVMTCSLCGKRRGGWTETEGEGSTVRQNERETVIHCCFRSCCVLVVTSQCAEWSLVAVLITAQQRQLSFSNHWFVEAQQRLLAHRKRFIPLRT